MRGFRQVILLTMIIGTGLTVVGQSNISVDHVTRGYGTSYRWVYDITQDHDGFLWFANHTGLTRYDGNDFVTYQHSDNDVNSLSTNTILAVNADHDGNIWAYGDDRIFNKLDLSSGRITRIHRFSRADSQWLEDVPVAKDFGSLSNGVFVVLAEYKDTAGQDSGSSLWRFEPTKNVFEHLLDVPAEGASTSYFTERSDGKLWVWCMGNGYYLVDLSTDEIEFFPVDVSVSERKSEVTLPIDEYRNLWYPSNFPPEAGKKQIEHFQLPDRVDVSEVDRMRLDNLGNIWFYHGENELYRFDTRERTLDQFVDPMFDKANGVQLMYHFFEDKDGAFWNGHFFGAVRFTGRPTHFRNLLSQHPDDPFEDRFSAREIIELSPGNLLVKNNRNELFSVDLTSNEIERLNPQFFSLSGESISHSFYSMVLDHDGYLWTNHSNKLVRTDLKTNTARSYPVPVSLTSDMSGEDPMNRHWPRIFEDASGMLWWCDREGIYIFDKTTGKMTSIPVEHPPSMLSASFKYGSYDPSADAIYCSYRKGIYILDCKTRSSSVLEVFTDDEGYDVLTTAVLRWNNEFWLSTNKGLFRYQPSTKDRRNYTRRDGLSSNVVYSTLAGDQVLWLATQHGLCLFDPYNMRIANYYVEQGLPHNEFNVWSYLKSSDGTLYFGGSNGVVGLNSRDFGIPDGRIGQLNLVEILKYNQKEDEINGLQNLPYATVDKVTVYPRERTVTFKYTLAMYSDVNRNQYTHYLEGLDQDWVQDDFRNEVQYLQIPPGKYIFRARATGPYKIPAANEISIPVIVKQYWFLRWWAITGYLVILGSAIVVFYRFDLHRRLHRQEAIQMRELDQAKTKMYNNITHEFRTPLTVMLGMTEAIREYTDEGSKDKVYHAVEMIGRNGKNLLDLVNQMLALSKLEAGLLKIHNRQGDIVAFLKYRLEAFQSYAVNQGIGIIFLPHEDEAILDYDQDKISTIVGNLVSNAIKFTPKNGKIFVVTRHLQKGDGRPFLELKVKDTGIGIDQDKIDRIFDRFYQVDDTHTRKGQGTGVGLALVRELVNLMGGTIEVTSQEGEGTEFAVHLPITNKAPFADQTGLLASSDSLVDTHEPHNSSDGDSSRPLILIVEDHNDVAHYINASISDSYRAVWAHNGSEGVEKAITLIPDVIISDVMMPEKDGFELCKAVKQDERTSHIPVILLTGKADIDSKIEGLGHGADAYLAKPFNKRELLVRIENLLALRLELQRRYAGMNLSSQVGKSVDRQDEFLLKVRSVVLEHLDEDEFNISLLCKYVHLSRAQLHRKIVALTGQSISSFIRKIQLETSRELLSQGELSVSEVAYKVGFKTQAHFSRVFSEACGVPPSQFRKTEN